MEEKNTAVAIMEKEQPISPFTSLTTFETAQRMANILCNSTLVPTQYQGRENLANCVIALELANRTGVSPFLIMQNMNVIQGRPSMSSQYLIGMLNASGRFSPLRWRVDKRGKKKFSVRVEDGWDPQAKRKRYREEQVELEDCTYIAWARELSTGDVLEGPEVTTAMALDEGWYGKSGSKWKTMPDLMFRYRSAAFFSRLYAPEMAMGLKTVEEYEDIAAEPEVKKISVEKRVEDLNKRFSASSEESAEEIVDVETKAKPAAEAPKKEETKTAPAAKASTEKPKGVAQPRGQQPLDFETPDDAFDIPMSDTDGDVF